MPLQFPTPASQNQIYTNASGKRWKFNGTIWNAINEGIQGTQGIQGIQGTQGAQGLQGIQGIQGIQGTQGTQGTQGIQGTQGTQGIQGIQGITGLAFTIAKTYVSVAALTADTAPTNIVSGQFALINTSNVEDADNSKLYLWNGSIYIFQNDLSGTAGIQGITGSTGAQGTQGTQGIQGLQGITGAQGITGSTGAQGTVGTTGSTGTTGATGGTGAQGTIGTSVTGAQGTTGASILGTTNTFSGVNNFNGQTYIHGEGNGLAVDTATAATARVGFMKYPGYEGALIAGNGIVLRLGHRTDSAYVYGGSATIREDLVISSTGNVGIGTASPAYKLHVGGQTYLNNGTNNALYIETTVADANTRDGIYLFEDDGQATGRQAISWYNGNNNYYKARIWTEVGSSYAATTFGIDVADDSRTVATRLAIRNGNVGIGTTAPSTKLEVGNFLDAVTNKITVSARYEYQPEFNFRLGQTGTGYDWIGAVISSGDDGNYNGIINFKTANAGRDTPTTKMVIKASGNVGIGTTSPVSKLHVAASTPTGIGSLPSGVTATSDSSTNNYLLFRNTADNGTYSGIAFQDNNIGGYVVFGNAGGGGDLLYLAGYGGGQLQYGASDSIAPGSRTTAASWGSAGVSVTGTLSATSTLSAPLFYDSNDTNYYCDPAGTTRLNTVNFIGDVTLNSGASSSNLYFADSDEGTRRMHCNSNRIGFLNDSSAWGSYCGDGGEWYSDQSIRTPIFYDNNNTAYYTDPASGSRLGGDVNCDVVYSYGYFRSQYIGYGLMGVYDSTKYQGVFTMGASWVLPSSGANVGNLYGMSWSHPNAGGVAGNLDSHGMIVHINGGFGSCMAYSIVASSNVTAYSDERLKTNWSTMPENFVERLAKVRVGTYDRIDGDRIRQVGVSAQSLRPLLPEAVIEGTDDFKTLKVAYGNAAMASAVELAKEVVSLKEQMAILMDRLNKLENK